MFSYSGSGVYFCLGWTNLLGAAGVGPWGLVLEVVGSKSGRAAAPALCVWHHSRNQIKARQRGKKKEFNCKNAGNDFDDLFLFSFVKL